jgi:hypothetical protein
VCLYLSRGRTRWLTVLCSIFPAFGIFEQFLNPIKELSKNFTIFLMTATGFDFRVP